MTTYKNLDADQGLFFEHELENIKKKTYEIQYPQIMARTVFPAAAELSHPGSQSVTYEMYDQVGAAKLLHSYAEDIPQVEVKGNRYTRQVYAGSLSHSYSVDDIDAASMSGKPMSSMKAAAVRRGLLQLESNLAFYGDPATDIPSFINNPTFNAEDATAQWENATAEQIIDDMISMQESIVDNSNGVEIPDTLILPTKQYSRLKTMPRSTTSDTSVLDYFVQQSPYITTVMPVHELKDSLDTAVNGSKDCAIMYTRSPDKLWLEVVKDVTFLPAQEHGLMLKVPAYNKTAGVIVPFPKAICVLSGI